MSSETKAPGEESGGLSQDQLTELFIIILLILLFFKFAAEAFFEKVSPAFGHNTGVVVILGIFTSWLIFYIVTRNK